MADTLVNQICSGCNGNFTQGTNAVQAMNKYWHYKCFVCDFCKSEFANGAFVTKYERPICKGCDLKLYGTYCKKCNSPIEGTSVKAINGVWHASCFVCAKCKAALTNGIFVEKNQKPFCNPCAQTPI